MAAVAARLEARGGRSLLATLADVLPVRGGHLLGLVARQLDAAPQLGRDHSLVPALAKQRVDGLYLVPPCERVRVKLNNTVLNGKRQHFWALLRILMSPRKPSGYLPHTYSKGMEYTTKLPVKWNLKLFKARRSKKFIL